MGRRLLLVEDDEAIRDMMSRRLALRGFEVATATDVASALAAARGSPFHAVVLDVGLPDGTGWDLARALRDDPRTAALRIVVVTAHAAVSDREAARASGCDAFLTKPVDFRSLVAALGGPASP